MSGATPWSGCAGLDDLGIAVGRANLQGLVDVPAAVQPLIEFAADWTTDPSITWNQLQFYSLADYYDSLAGHLEQITAPDYAAAWLQSTIDLDKAFADVIRSSYGQGIMATSSTSGAAIAAASQASDNAIVTATTTCAQFPQFVEEN